MHETIPVLKDENNQQPIPTLWRNTISMIVEALGAREAATLAAIPGVEPVSSDLFARIEQNIADYGDVHLKALPEEVWQTSACQWMRSYWEVLVDLFTVEEGASDLALSLRVYERRESYVFKVQSVHVP